MTRHCLFSLNTPKGGQRADAGGRERSEVRDLLDVENNEKLNARSRELSVLCYLLCSRGWELAEPDGRQECPPYDDGAPGAFRSNEI